jgi:hypothetical protein
MRWSGAQATAAYSPLSHAIGAAFQDVQLDVVLGRVATPLPATWSMMPIGLAGLRFVGYWKGARKPFCGGRMQFTQSTLKAVSAQQEFDCKECRVILSVPPSAQVLDMVAYR